MAKEPQNKRYTEILDELQLQSWQLELVISGFAIFGLFSSLEPIFDWFTQLTLQGFWKIRMLVFAIYAACILTIVNLIIHVLLRALWIGAVGIRSVSGEIDFNTLGFSRPITAHLKKKIGSFDVFIEKLENYSSVIFGLSFLIVFMTIGAFIALVLLLYIIESVRDLGMGQTAKMIVMSILLLSFFGAIAITFIDFISKGWFKRKGGRLYLLIYRVTSVVSLSVAYRPLLYNLWDNSFGKRLLTWLTPIYLIGIYFFSSDYYATDYIYYHQEPSEQFTDRRSYMDMIEDKGDYIGYAAIQSKIIEANYLEITMPNDPFLEEMVFEYDPALKPAKSRVGFRNLLFTYFHWSFGYHPPTLQDDLTYLDAINTMLLIAIDSKPVSERFFINMEKNQNHTLKKIVSLSNLKEGKHVLTIQRLTQKQDSTAITHFETIPFWYFPDNPQIKAGDGLVVPDLSFQE